MTDHIHPIFDRLLQRSDRERRLGQRSRVLWLTGLSGSGKSTIADALERLLYANGFFAQVLDGDNIRSGINKNLGFSTSDREENIRRIAEVAKLYLDSGVITINSFISPTRAIRRMAKEIVGKEDFLEVFIDTPLEICEQRDVKGLYAKARSGEITGFTGIDAPYEVPLDPFLTVTTEGHSVTDCAAKIYEGILPLVTLAENNIEN